MHKVVPIYYSEYGRYISRFRAIPLFIDALKPVERRLLLSLHEVAKKKLVKSAKVIGHVIGSYHPHGDQSAYGSLVDMVRRELVLGEGNFGVEGLEDDSPAAMRYTEVKANPKIESLGFVYHKFVKWEDLELDPEPLYIPSPIPIGLIGFGVITGISFYTTTIPRYKFEDLVKRLVWLLKDPEHNKVVPINSEKDLDPKKVGPIIKPYIRNCMLKEEEPNAFYKILKNGYGQIRIIPNGNIDKNKKMISVLGKSPLRHGFNILARKCDGVDSKGQTTRSGSILGYLKDLTKESPHIAVFPEKPRSQDLNELATQVWSVISPIINFNCQFSDFNGKIILMGIDDILILGYDSWVRTVLKYKLEQFNKLYDKFFEGHIIYYIRQMDINKITNVDDVIKEFQKNSFPDVQTEVYWPDKKEWRAYPRAIQEKDVREVCSKKTIRALLEVQLDLNKVMNDIKDMKNSVDNNDQECLNELKGLI
jgi:hypothetical protein